MKFNNNDRMISVRVPQEVYTKLDFIAEQNYTDLSSTIRQGLRSVITDNEDIHTFQYERVKDGQRVRQTNVTFFKDGKIYRHIGHTVQI